MDKKQWATLIKFMKFVVWAFNSLFFKSFYGPPTSETFERESSFLKDLE